MKQLSLFIFLLVGTGAGCSLPGSYTSREVTVLTQEQKDEYWRQLEIRWDRWFRSNGLPVPALPDQESAYRRIKFVTVPDYAIKTCLYGGNTESAVIKVGASRWKTGCVAHEIGHAVCGFLSNPKGCDGYEH